MLFMASIQKKGNTQNKKNHEVEVIVDKAAEEITSKTIDVFLDKDTEQEHYLVKTPHWDIVVSRKEIQRYIAQEFESLKQNWEILDYEITREKVYFKIAEEETATYIGLINYCRLGMDDDVKISWISEEEAKEIKSQQEKKQNIQIDEANIGIKGKDKNYSSNEKEGEKKSWLGRLLGF